MKQSLTGDEGSVSVGGFLITARFSGQPYPPSPVTTQKGWEGLPVHTLFHAPVSLLATIRNTTDQTLRYVTANPESDYRVDVHGGEIKREGEKILQKETLSGRQPLTLRGQQLHKASSGGYSPYVSFRRMIDELEPGESKVVRILVDQIFDLSVHGMYQIIVRHLFPVRQAVIAVSLQEYEHALRHNLVVPEISAEAVSNPLYIRAIRDTVAWVSDEQPDLPPGDRSD